MSARSMGLTDLCWSYKGDSKTLILNKKWMTNEMYNFLSPVFLSEEFTVHPACLCIVLRPRKLDEYLCSRHIRIYGVSSPTNRDLDQFKMKCRFLPLIFQSHFAASQHCNTVNHATCIKLLFIVIFILVFCQNS